MLKILFLIVLHALALSKVSFAYDNGVNDGYPIMGWSTWCTKDICGLIDKCSQYEVKRRADALVEQGMTEFGYRWILLDDCWAAHDRDENGELQPSHEFPDGMKALADYVHSKGLYLGLYTCVGTQTCKKNRPGSYGHYETDANKFASWGVDMVKADNCHRPSGTNETIRDLFTQFSKALNSTGHPMLFSMCEWGEEEVWEWGGDVSQMYRIQMDHLPFFHWPATAAGEGYGCGTAEIIEFVAQLQPSKYVKKYSFFDPDFLETLFPISMNYRHSRTEYTFWALWSAPLMVSTEILDLSAEKKALLLNPEVIAIQRDELFVAGERLSVSKHGGQVWYRPLLNGDMAIVLYNANNITTLPIEVTWSELGIGPVKSVRDLWLRQPVEDGVSVNGYKATIEPNDIQLLRLSQ